MIVKFEGKEYAFNGYVYPLNSLNELVNDAYNKGKSDAIDEFIDKFIKRTHLRQMTKAECIRTMYVLAEELKEQK